MDEVVVTNLAQTEANILTAGIISWALQNNVAPYSKEFEDAVKMMIEYRDEVLTILGNHYTEQGL